MKPNVIIVDLDGTLCNADKRKHFVENKKWDQFYENLVFDEPNAWCLDIINRYASNEIIFVSGRPEKYKTMTKDWLTKYMFQNCKLFMRKDNDFRKDSIIKEEIYRNKIEPFFNVMYCIDDRQQVVDMWRSVGLTCLQCAVGNF